MNSLSWFLYLADVLLNLGILAFIVCFVCSIALLISSIAYADGAFSSPKPLFIVGFALSLASLVAVLSPSKDTIYLIAASEAGEMVVNTPEAKEIMSDLKEILNIQLDKLKE